MRKKLEELGIHTQFKLDSAGTHGYHVGEKPDARTRQAAKKRGYNLDNLRARKLDFSDFYEFDYIFCMDEGHYFHAKDIMPDNGKAKIELYLTYAGLDLNDVPDPYYGGQQGFENVLDLIEQASDSIIKKLGY